MATGDDYDARVDELARFVLATDLAQYPATLDCSLLAAVFGCAVSRVHKRGVGGVGDQFPPPLKRDGVPKWSRALVARWIAEQGMPQTQRGAGRRRGPKSTAAKAAAARVAAAQACGEAA